MDTYEVTISARVDGITVRDCDQLISQLKDLYSLCSYDILGCPRFRIDDDYETLEEDYTPDSPVEGEITVYGDVLGSREDAKNFAWEAYDTFSAFGLKKIDRWIIG